MTFDELHQRHAVVGSHACGGAVRTGFMVGSSAAGIAWGPGGPW
jgi:hypothetical protein